MRRFQKYFVSIIVIIVSIMPMVFSQKALAQTNYSSGNTVTLPKDAVVNEDYFAAGGTVILDGTVNGDAYLAGGDVVINGTVNGDVLAAGGNISVNGRVTGDIRAAGGQIAISGDIGRNVTTAGGSIAIQKPAKIEGSVTAAMGNLSLLAPIGKGITVVGNQVSIDSPVRGNVTGAIQSLDVLPNASIGGKLTYWSTTQGRIAPFTVRDGVIYHHTTWKNKTQNTPVAAPKAGMGVGFGIIWAIVSLLTSFIVGFILLTFVPIYMQRISTMLITKPWYSLGVGFLAVILTPITCIVLLFTIVGIPLAVILGIAFIIFAMLSGTFISYAIGEKIFPDRNIPALLIGIIINGIIGIIPVIGWIWKIGILFIGMGAIIMVGKKLYLTMREKEMV